MNAVAFHLSPSQLDPARGEAHVLSRALDWLVEQGVEVEHSSADVLVRAPSFAAWAEIGSLAEAAADPEERAEIVELVEALERALTKDAREVELRLSGLPGQPKSRLDVVVRAASESPHGVGGESEDVAEALRCGPLLAAVIEWSREYGRATSQGARRSALLAANRCALAMETALRGTVQVRIADAVRKQRASRAASVSVFVTDAEGMPGAASIRAEVITEDGARIAVSPATHDAGSALVAAGRTEFVSLSPSQARALDELRSWKGVSKASLEAKGALEEPQRILSASTLEHAGEGLVFEGYSERVLGFRPALKGELARPRESYGIAWYDEADVGGSRLFAVIPRRSEAGSALPPIRIEDRAQAESLLEQCMAAITSAAPPEAPMDVQGAPVHAPEALATVLRDEIRKDDERQEKANQEATATRQGTLVAELADATRTSTLDHVPVVEPPWGELDALLAPGFSVLPHQREGIRWLWSRYCAALEGRGEERGALLADDMGLGKTFQIACVLALASAKRRVRTPHLILAPKILVRAWQQNEIERYFRPRTLSTRVVEGADLRAGSGALVNDEGAIRPRALEEHDVWLTNYDTVQGYGPALGVVDWHIVVLDEAQAIKNANTAASRNARALKKTMGIAATGTPVENSLADVFALGDFAFQGLLGENVRAFDKRYPANDETAVSSLRTALRFGEGACAYVLRRDKQTTLGGRLPPKRLHVERMPMADAQRRLELDLVQSARARKGGTLDLLSDLQKLYQHPVLLEADRRADFVPLEQLEAESPKLAWLRRKLREIAARGEKALVFTLWHRMQGILRYMLSIDYPEVVAGRDIIVNGDASSQRTALARIAQFSQRPGFDVLILSPRAAGTGLTITAANHVIHYGRWWNPAREDQATDRAYRIGQEREVHVWIPILHHPGDPDAGFDARLEDLMAQKRDVAADFLAPVAGDLTGDEVSRVLGDEGQAR